MEFLRQPCSGLFQFDGTASSLASARTDLRRIAEINSGLPIFETIAATVDEALTLVMPFDGTGEHLPHDAWVAYSTAEDALLALERRAGVKHTWHREHSSSPNPTEQAAAAEVVSISFGR